MPIPSHILEAIGKGECTLFLGAGASNPAGAPSAEQLCNLITDRFLTATGRRPATRTSVPVTTDWGLNLGSAVSLACAQPGITRGTIERSVLENLSHSKPSPAHSKIPWFRWRAIVTTNYDRLIETSYEQEKRKVQELLPVLKEDELPEIGATGSETIPLLKPHGCVSDPGGMSLSLEDIYKARQDRRLLFTYIEILHLVGPVIYIGYSFKDVHILDMIYDLTSRLGRYRKPILFVTLQKDAERAEKERYWVEGPLNGIYLPDGFERFMEALSKQITPAIVPSMIVTQMAPCKTMTFASNGIVSDTAFLGEGGEWEYWLTYSINHQDGYAGVIFERRDQTVDIRKYGKITLELSVPKGPRKNEAIEAKLESVLKRYELELNVKKLGGGKKWKELTLPFGKGKVPTTSLRRVVLADNGARVMLGREYKIGIRKIQFI